MKNKRVVVLLKFFKGELNPFDGAALETALQSGAKEIIALTMSPASVAEQMRSLTRLGVRAVLVSDKAYAGADTIATSLVLAEAVKRLDPDFIYCGRQSVDGDTAQVPPMLAQRLGYPLIGKIMETDGVTVKTRNGEIFSPTDRTVLTFERIKTLRFPSIFSKVQEVEVWDNSFLQIPEPLCGQKGSPTRVIRAYESAQGRRDCRFITLAELDGAIKDGLLQSKRTANVETGEKLKKIAYAGKVKEIAERLGQEVFFLETDGKSAEELSKTLVEQKVEAVLWEDDEERKKLASEVAVLLGAGLCADCISFRVEQGRLVMTRPAQGGNITADIVCDRALAMATVRTAKKGKSDVVFCVGKGGVEHLELIEAFAKRYGAELCSTRIVADSGKMPYETQVGLTGKTVSPNVYVAFGVSGAVQHTCAIESAGRVIAVNTDKQARIFDYADYGVVADITEIKNI